MCLVRISFRGCELAFPSGFELNLKHFVSFYLTLIKRKLCSASL